MTYMIYVDCIVKYIVGGSIGEESTITSNTRTNSGTCIIKD